MDSSATLLLSSIFPAGHPAARSALPPEALPLDMSAATPATES